MIFAVEEKGEKKMPRYIDAEELLHRLPNDLPYKGSVRRVLIQAPSADVQEVRRGRWIDRRIPNDTGTLVFVCSVCGGNPEWNRRNYCPNCGAKMKGGEEE